ncbi:MAG: DUF2339 domain-containing protein [Acidobacteriota bacterium]
MECFGAVLTLGVIGLFAWVIKLSRRPAPVDPRLEALTRQLVAMEQRLARLERSDGKDITFAAPVAPLRVPVVLAEPPEPVALPVVEPGASPKVTPAGAPIGAPADVPIAAPIIPLPPSTVPLPIPPPAPPAAPARRPFEGWEKNLATKAPIWLGAIALALAGVFLVKYSFEQGWISPAIRVALGILFGLGLLAGGEFLRKKNARIGEALSAAGIADLFACFLAGIHLYHLISPGVGFVLMVLTTAVAVGLSLRQGPIVAIVGLIGGYLTPLLVRTGSGEASKLFAYLLVLQIGLLAVSKKRSWWPIAGASLAAGLLWVGVWLAEPYKAGDGLWLGLFLLISAASAVYAVLGIPKNAGASGAVPRGPIAIGGLAVAASLAVLAFVAGRGDFAPTEIAMFGLLGAGALFLAHRRADLEPLAWVSAAMTAALTLAWAGSISAATLPGDLAGFLAGAAALGALYSLGGYAGLWKARRPGRWGSLSAAAALVFFLIIGGITNEHFPQVHLGAWSLGLAALGLFGALPLAKRRSARPELTPALAALAVAITTFVSLAAPLELEKPWIAVAWALEVAALVWLVGRFDLPALRHLARIMAGLVVLRLLFNPLALDYPIGERPIWNWLLYGYGVPLIAFAVGAWLARRQTIGAPEGTHPSARLALELEAGAIAFAFALLTLQIRQLFHPGHLSSGGPTFTEWSSYDAAWLLLGLGLLWADRSRGRKSLRWGGAAVLGLGFVSTLLGPPFLLNPLWDRTDVGALPVLNLLLFGFGVPIILFLFGQRELNRRAWDKPAKLFGVASLFLAFLLLTLEVRQAFHGGLLSQGDTTTAERYAYSVAWLIFGLVLLALGIRKKSTTLRWASLAVTLIAVAKVFLYDASNLTGLYRVVSFLGLGASLLGLAFVYQKFVFGRAEEEGAGNSE